MFKTLIRVIYSCFISIVLFSIILAGWTGYAFILQPTKSGQIVNLIQDMYESQKSVIIDSIELSKLLIKDTRKKITSEENNLSTESELLTNLQDKTPLGESFTLEDNCDNPLGIVIEPSLTEESETKLPEISSEPLHNEQSDVSMNEIGLGIEMN